ncbi:MAG TPA: 4-hydroxyphenylacetate 3-hydroxylase N-terminal domain-containing protein [Polyangiaceae bacterium]|nr:4-hydroxyphenylacetate 3-hydroxylase N-terminal domain-containing protein [Polyangiaceae bacterium]
MPMKTPEEYRASLRDSRVVYYRGKRVPDVTAEPELSVGVELGALDYQLAQDPSHRSLTVAEDPDAPAPFSAYYKIPKSPEDLLARSRLIEHGTEHGSTIPPLIKEIGTDALFALLRVLTGESLERARAFYRHCRDQDLGVAVAQTDVKGDRSLAPHEQKDPDLYVRIVKKDDAGIVVRGAKAHTSGSANAHELIVLPTRAMGPDDASYAVSFAVPVATKGVSLYVSPFSGGAKNEFEFPLSSKTKMLESLTVFEDVFVPWERVFLCEEPKLAGLLALTFVEYHRFTAVSYKLPLLDAMVGAAGAIAEMNGVLKAGHVRDKVTELITFAESVRGLTHLAAMRARVGEHGIAYPDPMTVNIAKLTFGRGYHQAVALLQECAGGLLATAPGSEDWESPEVRPVLEKFFRGTVPAADRLRMMHLISDITARDFGGYHAVLAIHAEGSIEAEKMQILRSYDPRRAQKLARKYAKIG